MPNRWDKYYIYPKRKEWTGVGPGSLMTLTAWRMASATCEASAVTEGVNKSCVKDERLPQRRLVSTAANEVLYQHSPALAGEVHTLTHTHTRMHAHCICTKIRGTLVLQVSTLYSQKNGLHTLFFIKEITSNLPLNSSSSSSLLLLLIYFWRSVPNLS